MPLIRYCLPLVLALLAGCQPAMQGEEPNVPIVWPNPPDATRIVYVRTIRRPDDLGISKGFFSRLKDIVFGAEDDHLVRPMAVLESGGALFVADPGARGVHRFNTVDGRYDLIQSADGEALPSPVGLARGADGVVYVTDSKLGQVLGIAPGARQAKPLKTDAELRQPTGIACDADNGRLYVVDTAAHDLKVLGRDGGLQKTIGKRGTLDGQFNFPTMLWRSPQGRLYVTDALNFRVQMLNEAGVALGKFGRHGDGSGDSALQKGVATDRYGHIYVVDAVFHAVQVFDEQGRFLLSFGGLGRQPGEFWLPSGIFIGEDDTIYVADSYNQRVQVFRYVGGPT